MALLDKIVYAGVNNSSFEQGSQDLAKLAEVEVSAKQVERVCKRIGAERVFRLEGREFAVRSVGLDQEFAILAKKAGAHTVIVEARIVEVAEHGLLSCMVHRELVLG